MYNHSAPAVHGRPDIRLAPQFADLKWIRADEQIADRHTHRVGSWRVDARLSHPWVCVALAHPIYTAVGSNDDHEAVLGRRREPRIEVGSEEDVALHIRDLQRRRRVVQLRRDGLDG